MNHDDLNHWSKRAADWVRDYHAGIAARPVRPDVTPGETAARLPMAPPEMAEDPEVIFADFEGLVPGAMTHWQHPRFFAYFNSNASPASMLAEQLANGIAAQCMLWQTSPAATEIEEVMIAWLRQGLGLADHFKGTIHDTATTATLSAVLTMRERTLGYRGLTEGLSGQKRLRIYASAQTHSSIDKAVRLAGIGQDNLIKIPTLPDFGMDPVALEAAIEEDLRAGHLPAGVIMCTGGTSIGACDDVQACGRVARANGLYTHLDAAWAGTAMLAPEFRPIWDGVDKIDSVIFNPHKWMGVQFDCAVQFLADPTPQVNTLGLRPAYLETLEAEEVTNFNEWTVPLGRRFRALKLWFVMRAYGLEGIRARIRNHVAWAQELCEVLRGVEGLEICTEPQFALFTFAHLGGDDATRAMIEAINARGQVYLTQTQHEGRFVIRFTCGSWACTRQDVMTVAREVAAVL